MPHPNPIIVLDLNKNILAKLIIQSKDIKFGVEEDKWTNDKFSKNSKKKHFYN